MSQWAGATLYLRVNDGLRDVYIPQGLNTSQHPFACWKLKRDQMTGRLFFVNLAGIGKRWRLPDIYEPQNAIFLKGPSDAEAAAAYQQQNTRHRTHSAGADSAADAYGGGLPPLDYANVPPYDATRRSSYAGGAPAAPAAAGAESFESPVRGIPAKPQAPTPRTQRGGDDGGSSLYLSSLSYVGMPADVSSRHDVVGGGVEYPAATRSPAPGLVVTAAADATDGGLYGDDGEWRKMSPALQAAAKRELELKERTRAAIMAAEEQHMKQLAEYRVDLLGDPYLDSRHASPERLIAERNAELAAERARLEEQARQAELAQAAAMIDQSRQRNEVAFARDLQAIEALEQHQLDVIRKAVPSFSSRLDAPPSSKSAAPAAAASSNWQNAAGRLSPAPSSAAGSEWEGHWHGDRPDFTVASSREVTARPGSRGGIPNNAVARSGSMAANDPAWSLVSEQLNHHRERAERLQDEVNEKERIIMEFKLADAERERREIALRVRMVEAMAAYRERVALLDEEEADARSRAVAVRLGSAGRAGSGSVPRHPLFEGDLTME